MIYIDLYMGDIPKSLDLISDEDRLATVSGRYYRSDKFYGVIEFNKTEVIKTGKFSYALTRFDENELPKGSGVSVNLDNANLVKGSPITLDPIEFNDYLFTTSKAAIL